MKLTFQQGSSGYDAVLKQGGLAGAGRLCHLGRRVLVVTDSGVPPAYAKTIAAQCAEGHIFPLPQGESAKTAESWQGILTEMLRLAFTQEDAIAAVGGGTVGDAAAFAAATYLGGVDFYYFPTTTCAQIDACTGGEASLTLARVPGAASIVYPPHFVLLDPATLATLPRRHYNSGLASAVKLALAGDETLLPLLEAPSREQDIVRIIALSLLCKKSLLEQGDALRTARFGRTIGRALEAACAAAPGPPALLHGECLALGMLPMIENKTLQKRARAIYKGLGLPLQCPLPPEAVLPHIAPRNAAKGGSLIVTRVKVPGRPYEEALPPHEIRLLAEELF